MHYHQNYKTKETNMNHAYEEQRAVLIETNNRKGTRFEEIRTRLRTLPKSEIQKMVNSSLKSNIKKHFASFKLTIEAPAKAEKELLNFTSKKDRMQKALKILAGIKIL